MKERRIMLKRKPHILEHKDSAERKLASHIETLKSKGATEAQIQKNGAVKHFKAKIRQATHQLAGIAALEKQIARKAEAKAEKQAAPKISAPKKKHVPDPAKKKAKKERPSAAAEDDE